MDYAVLDGVRCELVGANELWQFDLMKPQKVVQFAKDHRISIFNENTVKGLWRAGLLRADAIASPSKIEVPGLILAGEENGTFLYCDVRPVPHRPEGYGAIFSREGTDLGELTLYFHPFRLYVLYHAARVFDATITATQYLQSPQALLSLSARHVEHLDHWTSTPQCAERFDYWNRVSELAIVLEPAAYRKIFHSIRAQIPDTLESIAAKHNQHRERVKTLLVGASRQEIDDFRQNLCENAEIIDDNKMIHTVLRLMAGNERQKIRGHLGAAMLFVAMAETIRRAAEEAKGEQLREEDEMGFGEWMDGARKSIYGSERIFDAPREVRRDFLTGMGLDSGTKVKCYLEGETEAGALISAAGDGAGVEFINLRGQVIEKKGRGLAFVESLKNDQRSHVFSVVMVDADNADNVRLLKKAVRDGHFFGRYFVATPDFELANFTVDELVDVALGLAARDNGALPARDDILSHVRLAKSGKEFFAGLNAAGLDGVDKSDAWGEALMAHAVKHQELPKEHKQADKTRPVIEAAHFVINARRSGYSQSVERYTVDPETGELQQRQKGS